MWTGLYVNAPLCNLREFLNNFQHNFSVKTQREKLRAKLHWGAELQQEKSVNLQQDKIKFAFWFWFWGVKFKIAIENVSWKNSIAKGWSQ